MMSLKQSRTSKIIPIDCVPRPKMCSVWQVSHHPLKNTSSVQPSLMSETVSSWMKFENSTLSKKKTKAYQQLLSIGKLMEKSTLKNMKKIYKENLKNTRSMYRKLRNLSFSRRTTCLPQSSYRSYWRTKRLFINTQEKRESFFQNLRRMRTTPVLPQQ